MAFQPRKYTLLHTLLLSLLSVLMTSHATITDISCLKSIKDSLEDPYDYLTSNWNFNNNTEGFICLFNGVECWHSDENRVLNLKLNNMGLKGQFPRGLQNCSSLTGLDLSSNELTGPIPSDISTLLQYVTTIDLSNNSFSGEIPKSLANCTYLNSLKLDDNMLTGQIPKELANLQRLKTIYFADNHLSGPMPEFNSSVWLDLCGGPLLPPCSLVSNRKPYEFRESFKDGVIIGYVISLISFVAYASYFFFYAPCAKLDLSQRQSNHSNKAKELGKYIYSVTRWKIREIANHMDQLLFPKLVGKETNQISVLLERLISTWSLEELNDATDCFNMDNAIGMGKMGIMYQGALPNGQCLAVKRVFDSQLFKDQFLSEIMILSEYRHQNVMHLLGFCIERKNKILVYQYMPNGRLSKWLHPLESEVVRLEWPERFKIALGVARGLSWLHHGCNLCIVHSNICSVCILLDENFEPKISNFGEAKSVNPETEAGLGTMFKHAKKDVYDFGSVLFELITGKTYNELSRSSSITNICGNPSNFYNAIDEFLFGEGLIEIENEIFTLIKVACECVHAIPDQRPTMLEVYNNMSNIRKERHEFMDDSDMPRGSSEIIPFTSVGEIVEL